ncbi:MAG: HesA/MoeB/ThiF family protein [Candidatus Gastranaerophilales bacterium]|nr:HesA/MoeB/ThiF family protein [Candidatus Gastranaerophilales bacterium]
MERYSRNVLIEEIGAEGQNKLLDSKVLVAGTGGLGSSVIASLASLGIGTIGLVDNDNLELSNLNRQFIHRYNNIGKSKVNSAKEWIAGYNPDITVKNYQLRLNDSNIEEIIKDYDIVADCFDSYESKFMLNRACIKNKKILVHGGVTEFFGQIMTVIPEKSACLNCMFDQIGSDSYVIKGVVSPTVNVIGSLQAMEILKILLDIDKVLINGFLSYDGINQRFQKIRVDKKQTCPVCGIKTSVKNRKSIV